ncbi:MAG: phenylalanine--tRNA ligase subunit beta [Pseudomonadota bacterium]
MKISLEWLGQYVDLADIDPKIIADQLTMKTAEVEGVIHTRRHLAGVITGRVKEFTPVPGSDKLSLVTVDLGDEQVQSVCGAPNLRVGMLSAYAPVGCVLAGGMRVERASLAGQQSDGVLCSAKELGLGELHEGVMDLPESVGLGTPLSLLLQDQDWIIEIDNKSLTHRPDLWGHYGFARELAAAFNRPLRPLPLEDLGRYADLPAYPLQVDDFNLCPGYCCLELASLQPAPAPIAIQARLHSVGMRAINLLVDLTNYIMLEIGQPMHAFDADDMGAVRVAVFGGEGEFTTLDGSTRKMRPDDLMIWNQERPVGLAGVMGGQFSEVSEKTTRLVLEAANFQPMGTRRTAVRLGLRTDASQRFEKDLPRAFMVQGIARFLQLVHDAGQEPQVRSRLTHAGSLGDEERIIEMPLDYVARYMGEPVGPAQAMAFLTAIGFGCRQEADRLVVQVPPHRSSRDISLPQDLVEEVARFYGYDNIVPVLPAVAITEYGFDDGLRAEHKLRRFLAQGKGFVEVHNYSWYEDRWLAKIGHEPGETLLLANPVAPYKARLRTTLIPNLLELIPQNYAQREDLRLFEVGHVYFPQGEGHRREITHLGAVTFRAGSTTNLEPLFLDLKGAVEEIGLLLGCGGLGFAIAEDNPAIWAQPGCHLRVLCGGQEVGKLGYLAGPILEAFKRNAQIAWLELDLSALPLKTYPELTMAMPSSFPGSWLDFSILWPAAQGYAALESVLDGFGDELVQGRSFLAAYAGQGLAKGQKSYTFRYWIGLSERTLTKEDIEAFRQRFMDFLAAKGLSIR